MKLFKVLICKIYPNFGDKFFWCHSEALCEYETAIDFQKVYSFLRLFAVEYNLVEKKIRNLTKLVSEKIWISTLSGHSEILFYLEIYKVFLQKACCIA